jgi:hypothetical protein
VPIAEVHRLTSLDDAAEDFTFVAEHGARSCKLLFARFLE